MAASLVGPAQTQKLYIPVRQSDEFVELGELPKEVDDVLDILMAEKAPLHIWLQVAREYYRSGQVEAFLRLLEEGANEEVEKELPETEAELLEVRAQRVRFMCTSGAYYADVGCALSMGISSGGNSEQRRPSEQYLETALRQARKADSVERTDLSLVLHGRIALAKGEFDAAINNFNAALAKNSRCLFALLGRGVAYFHLKQYKKSLEEFRKVLIRHPGCPATVRLGIGYCFERLGKNRKARDAFERVLELEPDNVDALIAVAMLDLQTRRFDDTLNAINMLRRVYEVDDSRPIVLNLLAEHCFFAGDFAKAEQLSSRAVQYSCDTDNQALSYYIQARIAHAQGKFNEASSIYQKASKIGSDQLQSRGSKATKDNNFLLPHYGMGQLYLENEMKDAAASEFSRVYQGYPESLEVLKALGRLHIENGDSEAAYEKLKSAIDQSPRDAYIWLDLADVQQKTGRYLEVIKHDMKSNKQTNVLNKGYCLSFGLQAIASYYRGLNFLSFTGDLTDVERNEVLMNVYNNIGVLCLAVSKLKEAEEALMNSLGILSTLAKDIKSADESYDVCGSLQEKLKENVGGVGRLIALMKQFPETVTLIFNLARIAEEQSNYLEARDLYDLILHVFPNHTDSRLRCAVIYADTGDMEKAITEVNSVVGSISDGKSEYAKNAYCLLGSFHFKNRDYSKASGAWAKVGRDGDDPYATIAFANILYRTGCRRERDTTRESYEKEDKQLGHALYLYQKILNKFPNNMFAANGVGTILASRGHISRAREVFTLVQEAILKSGTKELPDVWINLAHIYCEQGQYVNSIKMYHSCLGKFYFNSEPRVLQYLARSQYHAGHFAEAKKTLLKAIHLEPTNCTLRFDLAVCMQEFSKTCINSKKEDKHHQYKYVADYKLAYREVSTALKVFREFHTLSKIKDVKKFDSYLGGKFGFDLKMVTKHVDYCEKTKHAAQKYIQAAESSLRKREQKIQASNLLVQQRIAERDAEEEKKAAEERMRKTELLRRYEENMSKTNFYITRGQDAGSYSENPTTKEHEEKRPSEELGIDELEGLEADLDIVSEEEGAEQKERDSNKRQYDDEDNQSGSRKRLRNSARDVSRPGQEEEGDRNDLDDDLADVPDNSQPADQLKEEPYADTEGTKVDDEQAAEDNMLAAAGLDSDSDDD